MFLQPLNLSQIEKENHYNFPYSKNITKKFINLLPNTNNINSIKSLSLNSEVDISNIYKELKTLNLKKSDGDLIFIGEG